MEAKRIKVVKDWPKSKSVQDIQVFLGFANFYQQFIQGFSKIVATLTSILKTTNKLVLSRNNGSSSASNRNDYSRPAFGKNDGDCEVDGFDGDDVEHAKKSGKSKSQKTSKSQKLVKSGKNSSKSGNSPNFGATETEPSFLTPGARKAFNHLWLAFTKAPIFWNFNLEYYIWIETNALGYAIGGVLSQLTSKTRLDGVVTKTHLGQLHLVTFFYRKIISAETRYETHNGKLLAIFEALKTWRYYLEGCKYEVFILMDHNNLRHFIDAKSLSSRQVCWAQKLSWYHFWNNYCQSKVNAAADALSRFLQRSQDEEKELRAENSQIFYCL